jgi:sister chromatid cohesion protein PDS5
MEFYLELISTADNASLLYHLSGKLKTVRDSESHHYSEVIDCASSFDYLHLNIVDRQQNLYALSELAQHLIKARAHGQSWTLQSYPGKIKLYSDILRPLPSAEAANEVRGLVILLSIVYAKYYMIDRQTCLPSIRDPGLAEGAN